MKYFLIFFPQLDVSHKVLCWSYCASPSLSTIRLALSNTWHLTYFLMMLKFIKCFPPIILQRVWFRFTKTLGPLMTGQMITSWYLMRGKLKPLSLGQVTGCVPLVYMHGKSDYSTSSQSRIWVQQ